ncbi:MAG: BrnT family toxin [Calditrichia bacterium]|jgi:uncharacterized DUF497 family protein|nr:BrnT family toxin [Calditrichia bacterium]
MTFEFDKQKSKRNKEKHGINFVETQRIWEDPEFVMIPARTIGESRYLLIGKYDNRIWSAIFTLRNQKIRLISVRRSRKNEEKIYRS